MPVLKSSKKALKVAKRRRAENDSLRKALREAIKILRANPTQGSLKKVYSLLDRAAKKHLVHKNRAARLKSKYSKLAKKEKSQRKPVKNK